MDWIAKNYKRIIIDFGIAVLLFSAGFLCGRYYGGSTAGGDGTGTDAELIRAAELNQAATAEVEGAGEHIDRASAAVSTAQESAGRATNTADQVASGIKRSQEKLRECQELNSRAEQLIDSLVSGTEKRAQQSQVN